MSLGLVVARQFKKIKAWHIALCSPFLPLLIVLIPKSFCLQLDPDDGCPWYSMMTTIPAIVSIFFLYPATLATSIVGAQVLSLTWVLFCIAYASMVSYGLYWVVRRLDRHRAP